jgi:hypothetical protein
VPPSGGQTNTAGGLSSSRWPKESFSECREAATIVAARRTGALRTHRKTTSAFAASPLSPALPRGYRGEEVMLRPFQRGRGRTSPDPCDGARDRNRRGDGQGIPIPSERFPHRDRRGIRARTHTEQNWTRSSQPGRGPSQIGSRGASLRAAPGCTVSRPRAEPQDGRRARSSNPNSSTTPIHPKL